MVYSHFFNLLATLAAIIGFIAGLAFLDTYIHQALLLYIAYVLYGLSILIVLIALAWPAANWLYLLVYRRTMVSFSQIRELSPLFYPFSGRWFPCKEVRQIDKKDRTAYLYAVLEDSYCKGLIKYPKIKWLSWLMGLKSSQ